MNFVFIFCFWFQLLLASLWSNLHRKRFNLKINFKLNGVELGIIHYHSINDYNSNCYLSIRKENCNCNYRSILNAKLGILILNSYCTYSCTFNSHIGEFPLFFWFRSFHILTFISRTQWQIKRRSIDVLRIFHSEKLNA